MPSLTMICLWLVFGGFMFSDVAQAQCYAPDGTEYNTDMPCDTGSFPTFCCPTGTTCYSNGLFMNVGGLFGRGTCTDETYKSDACTQECISENSSGSSNVATCFPSSVGNFCCNDPSTSQDTTCCNDINNQFHLGDPAKASSLAFTTIKAAATISSAQATTSSIPSPAAASTTSANPESKSSSTSSTPSLVSSSSQSSSATSSSAAGKPTGSSSSSSAGGASQVVGTTTRPGSQSSSPSSSATPLVNASTSSGLSTGAKAGIAVGAILFVALVAFLISMTLFFLRRNRQEKEMMERNEVLRAKEAANLAAAHDGRRGMAEAPNNEQKHAPPQYYHNDAVKYPPQPEATPYPPQPQAPYPVAPVQHQQSHDLRYDPNGIPSRNPSLQQHEVSPQPSHSELSSYRGNPPPPPMAQQYHQPPPSAASELAAARMRTNVSPLNGNELDGNGAMRASGFELPGNERAGHGFELP